MLFLPVKDHRIRAGSLEVARIVFYAKLNAMPVLQVLFSGCSTSTHLRKILGLWPCVCLPPDVGHFSKTNLMLFEDAPLDPFMTTTRDAGGKFSLGLWTAREA